MTEREAIRYKDAIRLQHTLEVRYDRGASAAHAMRAPGKSAS
jgi:hypothetical protein